MGRSPAMTAALPLLVGLYGCGEPSSSPGPGPSAGGPSHDESSVSTPVGCDVGWTECASAWEARRCVDGTHREVSRCAAGEGCVGGACVQLGGPSGPISPDSLWALRGEAWLNGWSVASPLPDPQLTRIEATPGLAFTEPLSRHALCAPDGLVRPLAHAKRVKNKDGAIATGLVVSERARSAQLWAGVAGHVRVFWNDEPVVDERTTPGHDDGPMFRDEHLTPIEVAAGVNTVLVVMRRAGGRDPEASLRIRDEHGGRLDGLAFREGDATARCSVRQLLSVAVDAHLDGAGYATVLSPSLRGLGPRWGRLEAAAWLEREGVPVAPLLREVWDPEQLAHGGMTVPLSPAPVDEGEHHVVLRVVSDGSSSGEDDATVQRIDHRPRWRERAAQLTATARALSDELPEGSRASFEALVHTIEGSILDGERYPEWLEGLLTDAEALAGPRASGTDAYRDHLGIVRRAYRSRLDGRLQPYLVYVPPSYDPGGPPLPLVLVAHGLHLQPEHALRTLVGQAPTEDMSREWAQKHLPALGDPRAILAAPWGYGDAGPRGIGEEDVLAVIDELTRAYRVDPLRVSLTGYSLGGTVAFVVPLHYPDRFSAAAPLCGYPNLRSYQSIAKVPHTPWEEVLIDKRYIAGYAENGLHLPLHIVHGGLDAPGRSKVIADRYDALGYRSTFDVREELGHDVWDYAYENGRMVRWLTARTRPETPTHVRLRTAEHRYDRAYWLRLLAIDDASSDPFADIDARYDAGELRLTTRNVLALSVERRGLVPATASLSVVVNDEKLVAPAGDGALYLDRTSGHWSVSLAPPELAGRKRSGVAGPIDDVLRHPLRVVYGTQRAEETDVNRLVAEHFASWDTYAGAHYPVLADEELSEDDRDRTSLMLIGRPDTNAISRAMASELPVTFAEGRLTFRGRVYDGDHVGVSFIHPHPHNADEYVVMHAGVDAAGTLASRHLPRMTPDFLVYDERLTRAREGLLLDSREVLDGGFFDELWR